MCTKKSVHEEIKILFFVNMKLFEFDKSVIFINFRHILVAKINLLSKKSKTRQKNTERFVSY